MSESDSAGPDRHEARSCGSLPQLVPSFVDGKPQGFKLFAIRPDDPATELGFRNGDVVVTANGIDLTKPMPDLVPLRRANRFAVEVVRDCQRMTIVGSLPHGMKLEDCDEPTTR